MQLSSAGLAFIKKWEGFRSVQYRDLAGNDTIGYGHKVRPPERFTAGITEGEATEMLVVDVRRAELAVSSLVDVQLTQPQFDALVDFCFNVGAGRLATSTLLRELNAGNYEEAGRQLLLWDHVGEKVIAGLHARREAELALWSTPAPAAATAAAQPPAQKGRSAA
jgi:lysozyme